MWERRFFAVIAIMVLLVLMDAALADTAPDYRKTQAWQGYKGYVIRFPVQSCTEYSLYDNGDLPQDLRFYNVPIDARIAPNSYGEIIKTQDGTNTRIAHEQGSMMNYKSYNVDSISIDLPKATVFESNCYGSLYIEFVTSADYETLVNPPTTTTIELAVNETNVNETNETIPQPAETTTTTVPEPNKGCDWWNIFCHLSNVWEGFLKLFEEPG